MTISRTRVSYFLYQARVLKTNHFSFFLINVNILILLLVYRGLINRLALGRCNHCARSSYCRWDIRAGHLWLRLPVSSFWSNVHHWSERSVTEPLAAGVCCPRQLLLPPHHHWRVCVVVAWTRWPSLYKLSDVPCCQVGSRMHI